MTTLDSAGRGQASISDRLAARALALAVDSATSIQTAADSLVHLSRGDAQALQRALNRFASRPPGRPSYLATTAARSLRMALELVADARPSDTAVGTARRALVGEAS